MKYILLIIPFLLVVFKSQAQTFEPGYLVLSSGDTLRGEVQNDFWEEPPVEVRFRNSKEVQVHTSGELQSVYLTSGRLLRRELLPIDRLAQVRPDRLVRAVPKDQQLESILADVWVDGPADLLGVTLDGVKHFFVRREQEPYVEMAERLYLTERNGRQYTVDANNYHAQLLQYFGDCPAAVTAAATADFTAKALTHVVQAYNQDCSAIRQPGVQPVTEQTPRPKAALQVGLTAGLRHNSLRITTSPEQQTIAPGADVLNGINADGKAHLQLGSYLDLVVPGRRLALHTAVVGALYGRRGSVTLPAQSTLRTSVYDWRGLNAAFQLGLRGLFPIAPDMQVLAGFGYEINSFWRRKSFTDLHLKPTYFGDEFLYNFRGSILPYLEVGLRYKRYTFTSLVRVYETQYFSHLFRNTSEDFAVEYIYAPVSLSVGLSYQLNRNTDKLPDSK